MLKRSLLALALAAVSTQAAPDSAPPTLLRAFSGPSATTLTITFSEILAAASVTNLTNYVFSGGLTATAATIGSDNKSVILTTSAQTPSDPYTVTVNGVTDVAGNAVLGTSSSFKGPVFVAGSLLARKFEGITGTAVNDLINNPSYPDVPNAFSFWPDFGITTYPGTGDTLGDNYGMEITGFIVPTTTADYEFYIRSDDASRLILSTNDSPAGARIIAFENGCCNQYTHNPGILSSEPIHLEAGKQYYVRAYVKEGGGGDFLYVGWRNSVDDGDITIPPDGSSVIPLENLATGYDPSVFINITQQPANLSVPANSPANFSIAYDAYSPVYGTAGLRQWQSAPAGSGDFLDIPGATGPSYSIPLATAADNGSQYRVVITLGETVTTSSAATLTVTADNLPPTVTAFAGNLTSATITFSEPIDDVTAAATTSYSISPSGTIGAITVSTNPNGYGEVKLDLSGLAFGNNYTVTIKDVKDQAGNTMTQVSRSFVAYSFFADFNDGTIPAGSYGVGVANVKPAGAAGNFDGSAFLELTAAAGSLNGTYGIGDVLNGGEATNVTIQFKVYVGNGSGNPADGFSVNVSGDIDPSTLNTSEEGSGGGLTIAFDTYDNGAAEAPSIDLKWGGGVVAAGPVTKAAVVNNQWVDVFIKLTGDPATGVGNVTVFHNNVKIHDAVEIAFAPLIGPKVSIGARTGGEFARHALDKVIVAYNVDVPLPAPPTISITSPPNDSSITAGGPATITVDVVATGGVKKVEFFANGAKLGESNVAPYSFTIPVVPPGIYVVTAKVTDNNDLAVTSAPVAATARPPAGAPKVLFLRATSGANASDVAVMNYLFSRGLDVYDTPALSSADTDAADKQLVMISSSVTSADVAAKFLDVATGVLSWEAAVQDDFLLTLNVDGTDRGAITAQTTIDLTAAGAAHQIGAGLSAGPITVLSAAGDLSWGKPTSSAVIIATVAGDATRTPIYAVEKNGLLIDEVSLAAGRRVHFMMTDATFPLLTADGLKLFDAATDWARGVGSVAPQPVISISKSGNQLTITWTNGGTLQQGPTVTGAWSDASTTGSFNYTIPAGAGAAFFRVIRNP